MMEMHLFVIEILNAMPSMLILPGTCWNTKSNAFYLHTIKRNTEVPGTRYMIKTVKFALMPEKNHCYLLLHIATMLYYRKNADFNLLTTDCGLRFADC